MAKNKKFYAVKLGQKPGIYATWEECRIQVEGFSSAAYKSFSRLQDAEDYLNGKAKPAPAGPAPAAKPAEIGKPAEINTPGWTQVVIYADGACSGNPRPGGYGVVLIHGNQRKELSAGFRLTTNNRMEILGCITGLEALKTPCEVTIHSDSKYVVNTMTKSWALRWRRNGWKRRGENGELKDALNADLWARMLDLCDRHQARFNWVRGHSGNEGNERCDQLARAAASGKLDIDAVYENPGKFGDRSLNTLIGYKG